jgi:bifunctional DNA-binding transcriptional regulator/antitoxin component of YhaV-PrlF toxin-antitoxin module
MPQLVKGGKHTYGWSLVGNTGRIILPPQALEEYRLKEFERLLLVPGSHTSGGFGLGSRESIKKSQLGFITDVHPELGEHRLPEGEIIEYEGKPFYWVELRNGGIEVPPGILDRYGIKIGDKLLVIRGSGLAIGFAVRGPIVEEARKHHGLELFAPEKRTSEDE